VGEQRVGQCCIEEHHRTASLEDAEVSRHDLPVVLRHRHGNDLVGAGEEGREGRGDAFRSPVELSESQRFSSTGNLQGGKMRKLLRRAAEDFREPADPFLMRDVHEVAVAKDLRQAVWAGVRLRHVLSRPKVAPPSRKRQCKENRDGSCCKNYYCQISSSHARS